MQKYVLILWIISLLSLLYVSHLVEQDIADQRSATGHHE